MTRWDTARRVLVGEWEPVARPVVGGFRRAHWRWVRTDAGWDREFMFADDDADGALYATEAEALAGT